MKSKTGKKSVTKQSKPRDRDRRLYRCPDGLAKLIALVNSISPDTRLPHPRAIRAESMHDPNKMRQRIMTLLKGVPKNFIDEHSIPEYAYAHFRRLRFALRDLANMEALPEHLRKEYCLLVYHFPVGEIDPGKAFTERFGEFDLMWEPRDEREVDNQESWPGQHGYWVLPEKKDGIIQERADNWMKSIGYIQHPDRLRFCKVCRQVFWARQNNMVACDSRCSGTHRQRLKRERDAQYEASRRKKKDAKTKAGKGRK